MPLHIITVNIAVIRILYFPPLGHDSTLIHFTSLYVTNSITHSFGLFKQPVIFQKYLNSKTISSYNVVMLSCIESFGWMGDSLQISVLSM